jgi:hypothetical protein
LGVTSENVWYRGLDGDEHRLDSMEKRFDREGTLYSFTIPAHSGQFDLLYLFKVLTYTFNSAGPSSYYLSYLLRKE